MVAFAFNPREVETVFGNGVELQRKYIGSPALIEQAKWEQRDDRISSCYPAAVLNAAILSGALSPEKAHHTHESLLSLPANWITFSHPDSRVGAIRGFKWGANWQTNQDTVTDIMYQHYANDGDAPAFRLQQLFHVHLDQLRSGDERITSAKQLIRLVLDKTVLVSSYRQHATTVFSDEGKLYEINPRSPEQVAEIASSQLNRSWVRKTGLATNRRILEAVLPSGN